MGTDLGISKKANVYEWVFETPELLQAWGRRFASFLRTGDVIALIGDLGAGKTTLVQGVASGLGYRRSAVSPTFALANEYETPRGTVYHMDMYRLSPSELRTFPVEEYWQDGICLVEWADRIRDRWPAETLEVHMTHRGPQKRSLSVRCPSALWKKRLASLRSRTKAGRS